MKAKVWRTGANEATVFEVNKDVTIEWQTIKSRKVWFIQYLEW